MNYRGMPIIESLYSTILEPRTVKRTLKERFFSLPWKPWVKEKEILVNVPNPDVFIINGSIVGHPATIARLREMVDA